MRRPCAAFTFIEVIACLLVVVLGLSAAVSMAYYAMLVSGRAQAKSTAMATAMTAAIDPLPLMHSSLAAKWQNSQGTSSGWLNGFWVVRTETAGTTPMAGFQDNPVSVDVYDGSSRALVASYTTWVMRAPFAP
jgi:hypothetical protein